MGTRAFVVTLVSILLSSLSAVSFAACAGSSSSTPRGSSGGQLSGKLTVFAAASLTDSFNEIGAAFKEKYLGVDVAFQFAGSPVLRAQLEQGARADVYASADQANMNQAMQSGIVTSAGKVFVRNSLVVITPVDNPGKINYLADLSKSGLKLVLANSSVPVGNYARQMLASMDKDASYGAGFSDRVLKNLVSEESDVKQIVAKVQLGEADAGVVYGTDVTQSVAPKLKTIAVPTRFNVIAEYPIAVTKDASNPAAAQAFIDFVLSPAGQQILRDYGFNTAV